MWSFYFFSEWAPDCNCAVRVSSEGLDEQLNSHIVSLEHLERLHVDIGETLPRALENSDLRTIFDQVCQYLEQLKRSLATSQHVYRRVFQRISMATTTEPPVYREIFHPRSFTTNSWDFIYYVEAFWHLPADLWTILDNAVEYFRFKCDTLEQDDLIDTWNEEFTRGERRKLGRIVEQLTWFTNNVERVHEQANIQI